MSSTPTQMTTLINHIRPGLATTVVVLTFLHIGRISSFRFVLAAYQGQGPALFAINGLGDFLVGLTAPFLAVWLWRQRGLRLWTTAMVWNAIALVDLVIGFFLNVLAPGAGAFQVSLSLLGSAILPLCHILALLFLTRLRVRNYYLGLAYEMRERHS